MASAAHYKRLAREIVEFSLLYPDDAPGVLAGLIRLMELVPYARTYKVKKRAGLH